MSGFFESMAERARGEDAAVRPRLPGRFEPSSALPPQESPENVFRMEAPVTPASPAPAIEPPSNGAPAQEPLARMVVAPPAQIPAPSLAAAALIPVTSPVPPHTEAAVSLPILALHQVIPGPRRNEAETPSVPAPDRRRSKASPPQSPPPVAPKTILSRQDELVAGANRRAPPPVTPQSGNARSELVQPMLSQPVTQALQPRSAPQVIVPRMARARLEPAPPHSVAQREETSVHVSIGRSEVRAQQPPTETRRREPAKPAVMSLDEYLRSRRGPR